MLRALIERGRKRTAVDYTRALAGIEPLNAALDGVFDEYDAILTPAAPGEAPRGLDSTGNPVFCTMWTYLGTPAVTLPLLQSESGMPHRRAAGRAPRQRCAPACARPTGLSKISESAARAARLRRPVRRRAKTRSGMMTNLITGLIGIAGVCAFLGIMLWWVQALPLIIIVVLVMALLI